MGSLRSVPTPLMLPSLESSCLEAFEQELDYIYRIVQRFGARHADTEDLLQEIFLVLHRNWPTLDTSRPLRPWLFAVAFRVVRSQRRRRQRETPQAGLDPEDASVTPEAWLQEQESLALLTAALELVPPERKKVLVMHEMEGLEVTEIAQQLSLTKFGVYARLYKGRKELASAVRRLSREALRK
jgi:RNA polymerase sigma-70 factor (ECF subfamily)